MRTALAKLLVLLVLVGAALSFIWRLQHGVNLSDEALHVSLPLRFALGIRPFIDELSSVQTYGLVTWPLASFYLAWSDSTDAIVAFFRIVFASMWLSLAASYWFVTKRYSDSQLASLAAAAPLVSIPTNIPSLSYLSLGMFAFSLLAFINMGLLRDHRLIRSFAIGFFTTLGAFAYPPALPALLYLAFRCASSATHYTLAVTASLLCCIPALAIIDPTELYHHSVALSYIKGGYSGSASTWSRMLPLGSPFFFPVAAALVLLVLRVSYAAVLPLAVASAYVVSASDVAPYAAHSNLLLILIPLLLLAEVSSSSIPGRTLLPLQSTLIASLLAYGGTALFSDYPATCAVLWFGPVLVVLIVRMYQRLTPQKSLLTLTYCALMLCAALSSSVQGRYTWEEAPIFVQSERVTTGPYTYLKTSPHRRAFLKEFERGRSQLISANTSVVGWGEVAPSFLALYYPTQYVMATAYPDLNEKRQDILARRILSLFRTKVIGLRTSFFHPALCSHLPLDQLFCAGKAPLGALHDQHLAMTWWELENPTMQEVTREAPHTYVE